VTVRRSAPFADELQAVLDVDAAVAAAVELAVAVGRLPIVLAGNCNVTLGVRAGLAAAAPSAAPAVVWLDAHGDFNTPESSQTGYLDGMPLAMLTGHAHAQLWTRLRGPALPASLVVLLGARDLDCGESAALAAADVTVVSGAELRAQGLGAALPPALDALAARAPARAGACGPAACLHVDIDVLDPAAAPGVTFPAPGGLTLADLVAAVDMVRERFTVLALSLTSFAPDRDNAAGATLKAGMAVMEAATRG
jgi:arginase